MGVASGVGCRGALVSVAVGVSVGGPLVGALDGMQVVGSLVGALGLFAWSGTAHWKISASLVSASIVVALVGADGAAGVTFFYMLTSSIAA